MQRLVFMKEERAVLAVGLETGAWLVDFLEQVLQGENDSLRNWGEAFSCDPSELAEGLRPLWKAGCLHHPDTFQVVTREDGGRTPEGFNRGAFPKFFSLQRKRSALLPALTAKKFGLFLLRNGEYVARIAAIPLCWDGTVQDWPEGYDDARVRAHKQRQEGVAPNTACAMAAVIPENHRGGGLSGIVLEALKDQARNQGFRNVILPVRPTLKNRYPTTSMEEYLEWTRDDGEPFDPWLRIHARAGGTVLRIADRSFEIVADLAEFEQACGQTFPASGDHIVEGALCPVQVNLETRVVSYTEPNVWVHYAL